MKRPLLMCSLLAAIAVTGVTGCNRPENKPPQVSDASSTPANPNPSATDSTPAPISAVPPARVDTTTAAPPPVTPASSDSSPPARS